MLCDGRMHVQFWKFRNITITILTTTTKVRFGTSGGRRVDKAEQKLGAHLVFGSTVPEVGTATGRFAASLMERKSEYTGIDLSQAMLRATKKRTDHSANLFQMDGCHLAFRGHFDCVLCVRTFHFLLMPVDALRGMLHSLKPLGRCLVTFKQTTDSDDSSCFFELGYRNSTTINEQRCWR